MKSRIEKKLKRKSNPDLVEAIIKTKKNDKWLRISHQISTPRRKRVSVNLKDINDQSKDGDSVVVPGKVLSEGNIEKKIKVSALIFSDKAKQKLMESKIPILSILEEIKKNPNAENIKIIDKRMKRY